MIPKCTKYPSIIFKKNMKKICKIIKNIFSVYFQSLCGVIFEVPTMTGEKLRISTKHEIIKPNTVKRIQGYGLPLPRDPTRKGDLLVAFDIKFPSTLTPTEKELLADLLPDV